MRNTNTRRRMMFGVAVGLLSAAALSTQLFAQPPSRGGRDMRGGFPGMRDLDLSEVQRQGIRDIRQQNRSAQESLNEHLRAAMRALNEAVMTDGVNEPVIRALAAELAILESEAAVQRAHTYAAILSILTPDQRTQLTELPAEAKERFRERRQERRREWRRNGREERRQR